jgi:hypothetical protein
MQIAERPCKRPGRRLLTAALLTSAVVAASDCASAASWLYWGPDRGTVMMPPIQRRAPKAPRHRAVPALAEKNKPEGPLIITISIQHQQLKVYDVNGLYAESPVSTGMPGHSTPMGVFSVLEKQRWHRSNIYSGAPMPYMQRVTWSGVAIHEGVLPGYPASHGCIRMPGSFAVKLWAWTKRGARVIIVPGEISPQDFSHPKLIAHMVDESPPSASAAPTGSGIQSDASAASSKTAEQKPELKLATLTDASSGNLVLTKSATDRQSEKTAEPKTSAGSTIGADTEPRQSAAPPSSPDANAESPSAPSTDKDVEQAIDKIAATVDVAEVRIDPESGAGDDKAPADATAVREARTEAADTAAPASETAPGAAIVKPVESAEPKSVAAAVAEAAPQTSTPTSPLPAAAPAPTTGKAATAAAPDPKDVPTVIGPKRSGHVAVFISRKDRRLYVRQNFMPLFDVPVAITDPDKPFGTFVFTSHGDKDDATALHWSVVAMPFATRKIIAAPIGRLGKRPKSITETTLTPPPATAAEALDRITVPDWALERVAEAIKPGGSLIVSDRGLGDETGEGTDFIVPLR